MPQKESFLSLFIKGAAMGAANVIPGVSGGTIAFITGIYERLIYALKSFNTKAAGFLLKGKLKDFAQYTDLGFLGTLSAGVAVSILSLAKLLEYLFDNYPVLLWAFFFGLILASVYYVGKQVQQWNAATIVALIIGTAIAVGISLLNPAQENTNFWYVFICGIVAICSMILPGLSGSFILIIMGNYLLILKAIGNFNFNILLPLGLGCAVGMVAFSNLLSYIFKRFPDVTIALLTGFILGSLNILWPWKEAAETFTKPNGEVTVLKYAKVLPNELDLHTLLAIGLIVVGIVSIFFIERLAKPKATYNNI